MGLPHATWSKSYKYHVISLICGIKKQNKWTEQKQTHRHMPGLQAGSLAEDMWEATYWCFSATGMCLSLPPPLSKNKFLKNQQQQMPASTNTVPFQPTRGPGFLWWSCSSKGVLSTWIPESSLLKGCWSSSSSLSSDQFWLEEEIRLTLTHLKLFLLKDQENFRRKAATIPNETSPKCLESHCNGMRLFLVLEIPTFTAPQRIL